MYIAHIAGFLQRRPLGKSVEIIKRKATVLTESMVGQKVGGVAFQKVTMLKLTYSSYGLPMDM